MARVVATMFVALDGVVQDPHTWSFPYWSEETSAFKLQELRDTEALLLGRVTYEGFAAAWPGRTDPDGFAEKFNRMPKYVATRTLKKLEWNNSHVLGPDVAAEVAKLKQQGGKDLTIHGSVTLLNHLLERGLVDRLNLLVYPLLLGKGKRLFAEGTQAKLRLVESKLFPKGVQALVYEVEPPNVAPK
jgi:dihydrofolate reductase